MKFWNWMTGNRPIVSHIEAFPNRNGNWHWYAVAYNNERLPEEYNSKAACLKTAQQVADQLGVPLSLENTKGEKVKE